MHLFGPPDIARLSKKGDVPGLIKALDYQSNPHIVKEAAVALSTPGNEPALAPLLRLLADTHDEAMADTLLHTIATIQNASNQFHLHKDLEHEDPTIRRIAATRLGQLASADAIAPLLAVIKRRDQPAYRAALTALAVIGAAIPVRLRTARIVEPLAELLKNDRIQTRDPGLIALEFMGWEPGVDFVEPSEADVLQHKRTLRALVFRALEAMGWQPDASHLGAACHIAQGNWARCIDIGAPAVEPLIAVLREPEDDLRTAARNTLVAIGAPAVPDLIDALDHSHPATRESALHALRSIGAAALPAFASGLHHPSARVRHTIVTLITSAQQQASKQALPLLIEALGDADMGVRQSAIDAITTLAATDAAATQPRLIAALTHENQEVRWSCAALLDQAGWQPANADEQARYWIARREWHRCIPIGAAAVPVLIEMLDHWDKETRRKVAWSLMHIGPPAIDPLIAQCDNPSASVRTYAIIALGMIGSHRALPTLEALCNDHNKNVARAAQQALDLIHTRPNRLL